ncbi:MAG: class I SAM-dependent methyltransferase [Anaerolineaceae bacterium]|nr:class I SAM-dependent methyltransferase [Anaerolineaceae bacterium]
MNEKTQAAWNQWSEKWYQQYDSPETIETIIRDPKAAFPKKTFELIQKYMGGLEGKKICVPSSGDNIAVFAFHLLGAEVTSLDLSQQQITHASQIAADHKWNIGFQCEDSMDFTRIASNRYDLVYTSNGAHVWISDLERMYRNFHRVLKPGGCYIFFETHPFIRPFDGSKEQITIEKSYEDIGPFEDGTEFHWRFQDFLNAVLSAGFQLKQIEEFHAEVGCLSNHNWWYGSREEAENDQHQKHDWHKNPWAALPQWFSICAQKITT